MFNIIYEKGVITMSGRLDASQVDKAKEILDNLSESVEINLKDLEYISSAGLGLFISVHTKLSKDGKIMKISNLSDLVKNIFHLTRLDEVFEIQ